MNLIGKTAAVIGLARAGAPAARFLAEKGAKVIGYDSKPREKLSAEALELETVGVELQAGEHNFAGIEKCDLIVLSPGLKVHHEPLESLIARAEARGAEVIGELELASRYCPCPIIGVTGTKGKSTTTKLITEMLRACGVDAVAAGNTGTPLIAELPNLSADSWAVIEVSSFQLEKAPTFRPRIAVLLSLLEDHQDYHPDLEQYWKTKLKIFANQVEGDTAIYNIDDPRVLQQFIERKSENVVATTSHNISEFPQIEWINNIDFTNLKEEDNEDLPWLYVMGRDSNLLMASFSMPMSYSVADFPLRGGHNRSNLAAALAAVHHVIGLNDIFKNHKAISEVIRNFQNLPHRLEVVAQKDGITWVNDSQSTIPDATIAALRSFSSPVTLIAGGRAKIEASAYEPMMATVRETKARIFLIGEAAEMLKGVALSIGVEKTQIFMENTLAEALRTAKIKASVGETVLLSPACASFDQFTSYEHRGDTFRDLVREV